jgi:hypothetical protein
MVDILALQPPALASRHGTVNRYHNSAVCSSFVRIAIPARIAEHFLAQKPCMMAQTMISSAVLARPNLRMTNFRANSGKSFARSELH